MLETNPLEGQSVKDTSIRPTASYISLSDRYDDYDEIVFDIYTNGSRNRSIAIHYQNFSSFLVSALKSFDNPLINEQDVIINTDYPYILNVEQIKNIKTLKLKEFQKFLCKKGLYWGYDTDSALYYFLKFAKYGGGYFLLEDDGFYADEDYDLFIQDTLRIDEFLFDHLFRPSEYGIPYLSDFCFRDNLSQKDFICHIGQFISILDANLLFPTYL